MYFVYHLIDPPSGAVRYVGMSKNPRVRLVAHIREARQAQNTGKKRWIAGLLRAGTRPLLVIAGEYGSETTARNAESANCHEYRATILNLHDPKKGAKDIRKEKRAPLKAK